MISSCWPVRRQNYRSSLIAQIESAVNTAHSSTSTMASNGIARRMLIQNQQLEQVDTFPYLGSLITEDGERMTEFRTRLNRGRRSGHHCRKYGNVIAYRFQRRHYTTNESASVVRSNVPLWKLDTQKEGWNTSWRLWDERAGNDSAGFVDSKENKWVGS